MKVLSTYFYVKKMGFTSDVVNNIVAAIKESFEEDRYKFISEYGAKALYELSMQTATKKTLFVKIISNILQHVSTKYDKKKIKISEDENGYNLKGEYMGGVSSYIKQIGANMPDWAFTFKDHFIKDFELSEQKNPQLFLISGTIDSLLSVCKIEWFKELLTKLDLIVNTEN